MTRRTKRVNWLPDAPIFLSELETARRLATRGRAAVTINGRVYVALGSLIDAIDDMAKAITGDHKYFYDADPALRAHYALPGKPDDGAP